MRTEDQARKVILHRVNTAINKQVNIECLTNLLNEYIQGIHTSKSLNDLNKRYAEEIEDFGDFKNKHVWFENDLTLREIDLSNLPFRKWRDGTEYNSSYNFTLHLCFYFKNYFEYTPGIDPEYPELEYITVTALDYDYNYNQRFSNVSNLRDALTNSSLNLT